MDALLTINAGTQMADAIVPPKPHQKPEEQFGKVLNRKRNERQPEKKSAEKHTEPARRSEKKQAVARQQETESQQVQVEKQDAAVEQPETDTSVTDNVVVAEGETEDVSQVDAEEIFVPSVDVLADSDVDAVDSDTQLNELVEALDLDVSADENDSEEGDDVNLTQQTVAPPVQPAETIVTPQVVEQVAVTAAEPQQQVAASQNRSVKAQEERRLAGPTVAALESDGEVVSSVDQKIASAVPEEVVEQAADDGEKLDPRFASLLKPRTEKQGTQPLREAPQLHGAKVDGQQTETVTLPAVEGLEVKHTVEASQLTGLSAKDVLDQLTQTQPGQHLQGQGQGHVQSFDTAKAMPQTPMVQLSNGYQIPESQVFDQVVTQISGSINGESGRMVLRLQPAELGSLKLELKIEGDRVQANLHAQTHQVQEVLERNLPQLRSALADQGLKIDQFQVNVDQRQTEGQFEGQAQYQQHGAETQADWHQQDPGQEEHAIPLAHLMQGGGGGISLHV